MTSVLNNSVMQSHHKWAYFGKEEVKFESVIFHFPESDSLSQLASSEGYIDSGIMCGLEK